MKTKVSKDDQIKVLQREKEELLAQLLHMQATAYRDMPKAGTRDMMASAVIISINALGGRPICKPFAVADGLSEDTIKHLMADIKRSMDQQLTYTGMYKERLVES